MCSKSDQLTSLNSDQLRAIETGDIQVADDHQLRAPSTATSSNSLKSTQLQGDQRPDCLADQRAASQRP